MSNLISVVNIKKISDKQNLSLIYLLTLNCLFEN